MDYIKRAEDRLKYYKDYSRGLINLQGKYEALINKSKPLGYPSNSRINITGIKDEIEQENVEAIFSKIEEVAKNIDETKAEIDGINTILKQLESNEDEKIYAEVLRKWYMDKKDVNKEELARTFHCSRRKLYSLRNEAINKFARLAYGVVPIN